MRLLLAMGTVVLVGVAACTGVDQPEPAHEGAACNPATLFEELRCDEKTSCDVRSHTCIRRQPCAQDDECRDGFACRDGACITSCVDGIAIPLSRPLDDPSCKHGFYCKDQQCVMIPPASSL